VNRHLVNDLIDRGLWNTDTKNAIVAAGGSIQNIPHIDDQLKALYKTVWEIKQRVVVEMAAERGAFIDQSQSMNIHLANPTRPQMYSMHMTGWKAGLKTGLYYLRTKPVAKPIQFTVTSSATQTVAVAGSVEKEEEEEGCLSCGA
jgi:ribonucleoside-diphosphate reductase subunit M1